MALLSSISDIWELGLELTRLAAADIEITEAQREQWTTEERDLATMRVRHQHIRRYQQQLYWAHSSQTRLGFKGLAKQIFSSDVLIDLKYNLL